MANLIRVAKDTDSDDPSGRRTLPGLQESLVMMSGGYGDDYDEHETCFCIEQ